MTDDDYTYWTAYVRQIADLLNLKDWRIDVFRDRSEDGTEAQVHLMADARRARIALGDAWAPERRRKSGAQLCMS